MTTEHKNISEEILVLIEFICWSVIFVIYAELTNKFPAREDLLDGIFFLLGGFRALFLSCRPLLKLQYKLGFFFVGNEDDEELEIKKRVYFAKGIGLIFLVIGVVKIAKYF